MQYSKLEGQKRSIWRAVKIGAIVIAVTYLGSITDTIPIQFAPIVSAIVVYLEKLERNYREIKKS